ncbi:MAG: chemotaxis protein CheA, partial [Porticoccaceae bacterium]
MSTEADDELLQDFLTEAGEILDTLGGMLVELEQRPRDTDLLNTVFRGFHTIKGGAGFLSLDAMVAICHHAEEVFNVLRQGERSVDAELMDAVFRALDVVKEQFQQLEDGVDLTAADDELLDLLDRYATPEESTAPNMALAYDVAVATVVEVQRSDDSQQYGNGEFPGVTDAEFAEPVEIGSPVGVADAVATGSRF